MQSSSKEIVKTLIKNIAPHNILDCPAGNGWLVDDFPSIDVDGIDLYANPHNLYRQHLVADLDNGIPDVLEKYDLIVSCEGIEHLGNPELFLRTAKDHLNSKGVIIITTPNTWYPASKAQFGMRGFFPSFPCLIGKITKGSHMHIMPWSFPQLYLFLRLTGFENIQLHQEPLSKPKHWFERVIGWPQTVYCQRRKRKASTKEEQEFWAHAGSEGSVMGRHLIVTASKKSTAI